MIKIRVPATSANLGPGFDCLGLALGLYNTFEIEPSDTLRLDQVEERFNNEDNLFVQAYRAAGGHNIHAVFDCNIPVARGLGSSAALISAGICAAKLLDHTISDSVSMFELASRLEGHPDNAAPCLFGGLTACLKDREGLYTGKKLSLSDTFVFTVLIPDFEVSTHQARAIMPDTYSRADASWSVAHAVLTADALCTGDLRLLQKAAQDVLHEPYRKTLIHGFDEVKSVCVEDTDGVFLISGSGSTCLLISKRPLSQHALPQLPSRWNVQVLQPAFSGCEVWENGTWHPII